MRTHSVTVTLRSILIVLVLTSSAHAGRVEDTGRPTSGVKTSEFWAREQHLNLTGGNERSWHEYTVVTELAADSDFRANGLRIGDLIVGCQGVPYTREAIGAREFFGSPMRGEQFLENVGASSGDTITIAVERDGRIVEITAEIQNGKRYYDDEGRELLGPGGPPRRDSNGFGTSWAQWAGNSERSLSRFIGWVLNYPWYKERFNNQRDGVEVLDEARERLAYLVQNYPGSYSQALLDDWRLARETARGPSVEVTAEDLSYLEPQEGLVAQIADAARVAEADYATAIGSELLEGLPDTDPYDDGFASFRDRVVRVEQVTSTNRISDGYAEFYTCATDSGTTYAIAVDSPPMTALEEMIRRYQTAMEGELAENYSIYGRISDDTAAVGSEGGIAIVLEPVAVMVDDQLFARLGAEATENMFAGEELLAGPPIAVSDDAEPEVVLAAMIDAVKYGNEPAWRGLFSSFRVSKKPGSSEMVLDLDWDNRRTNVATSAMFERSRRTLEEGVLHVAIHQVGPPRKIHGDASKTTQLDSVLGVQRETNSP